MSPLAGDEARDTSEPVRPPTPWFAALLTVGALGLAAVHLAWPHLRVDGATIALVVIAIVPWLAPIFKTIELPGGWKFEYQEIRRQVQDVQDRVEQVERLVISGDTTPALDQRLNDAVQGFARYLRGLHPRMDARAPSVVLIRGLRNAQYVRNQIQLDPDLADDYAVLREYVHHLLTQHREFDGLESGVADYFVASYQGQAVLGVELARMYRDQLGIDLGRAVRNLDNELLLDETGHATPQEEGEVWGAAFWQLRGLLTQDVADTVIATAWFDDQWSAEGAETERFPEVVLRLLDPPARTQARDAFERRGLLLR